MNDCDAVIVGAGALGSALAVELVARGLRPIVVEQGEPGARATAASFGVLHSGLRYLQTGDLARSRRSRRDQGWWSAQLPEFVQPALCTMPLYRGCARSPLAFRAAYLLERVCGFGLPAQGRALHKDVDLAGGLAVPRHGLVGWAQWEERLLHAPVAAMRRLLHRAEHGGAVTLSHSAAVALSARKGQVAGLRVQRHGDGRELELRVPVVLLCAGAGSRSLARRLARDDARLSCARLGFNLLLAAPSPEGVLALSPRPGRGRCLFLRREGEHLLAGTWYVPWRDGVPPGVEEAHIERALDELSCCLPGVAVRREVVVQVLMDVLPDHGGAGMRLRERDGVVDHGRHGGPRGLYSLLGTKLTTAPSLAARVGEQLAGRPQRSTDADPAPMQPGARG